MSGQIDLAEKIIRQTEQLLRMQAAYFGGYNLYIGDAIYTDRQEILKQCKRAEKTLYIAIKQYWLVKKSLQKWTGTESAGETPKNPGGEKETPAAKDPPLTLGD